MGDSPPIHAVVAIVARGGKFLFVKRSELCGGAIGYWTPVSGRIEPGESQQEACSREVYEEVGLRVRAMAKLGELPTPDGQFLLHYWMTEIVEGDATVASPEVAELRWATVHDMRQLTPHFEDDLRIVEQAARSS
jgi:8-oxo-dGTP diphosphatase